MIAKLNIFQIGLMVHNKTTRVKIPTTLHLNRLGDWLLPLLTNGQSTVKEAEEKADKAIGNAELSRNIASEPKTEYNT